MFIDDSDVYNNEISYNYYILWPILNSLSKSIQKTKFSLGEKRLEAVSQELKLIHNDNRHFYNADGIISNIESEIEIAFLETTGPLLQQNDPKETQDYIKAGYGLIAMLHVIGRKFHYGDFEIFKKIGSFFVQATRLYFLFFLKTYPLTFYFMVFFSNKDQDLESIYASKQGLCDQLYWFSRSANRIKNVRGKNEKVDWSILVLKSKIYLIHILTFYLSLIPFVSN